jgi:hypothetical protein
MATSTHAAADRTPIGPSGHGLLAHTASYVDRTNPKLAPRAGFLGLPTSASLLLAGRTSAALEAIGGAPKLLVPDNAKMTVIKACHFDPVVNRSYAEVAAHYDMAVLPARQRKPRTRPAADLDRTSPRRKLDLDRPSAGRTNWTRRRLQVRDHPRWYEAHLLRGGILRLGLEQPPPSEQQRARNAVSQRRRCDLERRL